MSIDEFMKSDIRVVKVLDTESSIGKGKILKLTVEAEDGKTRTIVAGGARYYPPEHCWKEVCSVD
jgi:tRNA-binding EMAP/Myf-like protein